MIRLGAGVAGLLLWNAAGVAATSSAAPTELESAFNEPATTALPARDAAPREIESKPATLSGNPLWAIPLKQLSATRDRPIFSPSRRPPPPAIVGPPPFAVAPPPAPAAKEPDRPELALLGTIIGTDEGIGIFMDQTNKTPVRIRVGTSYQGWLLRVIKPGAATFEKSQLTAVVAFPKRPDEKRVGPQRLRPLASDQGFPEPLQTSGSAPRGLPMGRQPFKSP